MKVKELIFLLAIIIYSKSNAQIITNKNSEHHYGLGINGGITLGTYDDSYSNNVGIDLYYLYNIHRKLYIGGSTGLANYLGNNLNILVNGNEKLKNALFIPLLASLRFSPYKNFLVGPDIGFAIRLNSGNDGGFYISPRVTYFIEGKFPVFAGYRLINLNGKGLGSIQFGLGYKF